MAITAVMVKELRERTGVGMMECKKALVETDGDMDAAIELLRKSLHRLPTHYSEILDLRFSDGLSYKGIAERLGVPMTTVEARLHRARRMLRRVLGDLLDA